MKKNRFFMFLLLVLLPMFLQANVPHLLGYQMSVRDLNGNVVIDQPVAVHFEILQCTAGDPTSNTANSATCWNGSQFLGNVVYDEELLLTTDANGLITYQIGEGSANTFADIDWSEGTFYLRTFVRPDLSSEEGYKSVQQLVSVPYAFYADRAATASAVTDGEARLQEAISPMKAELNQLDKKVDGIYRVINTPENQIDANGALAGVFSVSSTKKVNFSRGNLQYSNKGTHATAEGTTVAGTWRFATNQYDYIGTRNNKIAEDYEGYIDLLGWGTSGAGTCSPNLTSQSTSKYGNGSKNLSNTNYDWGFYNAISNGGNTPGLWRTLTKDEWNYLISRNNKSLTAMVEVAGVAGLMLLPDNFNVAAFAQETGIDVNVLSSSKVNKLSVAQWSLCEGAGCVFLPAAGQRDKAEAKNVTKNVRYWLATYSSSDKAFAFVYTPGTVPGNASAYYRYAGRSVRLVRDVQ